MATDTKNELIEFEGHSVSLADLYRAYLRGEYNRLKGAPGTVWARGRDPVSVPDWYKREIETLQNPIDPPNLKGFAKRVRAAFKELRRTHGTDSSPSQ